jgi:2-polyprenyl-3-methyl-5-hydroxy-6-metoxy-1,4-benzoquinol methylase
MSCCNSIDDHFATKHADRDLKQYEKNGPNHTTRLIIAAIRSQNLENPSLLDIGGGIGALQHELLGKDVGSVIHLDASPAYLDVARRECRRRGNEAKVSFVQADFTDAAEEVGISDIVTLDRVICCYPNYADLIDKSAGACRHVLAVSYPRTHILSRVLIYLDNLKRIAQKRSFRAYIHPRKEVEARIETAGFEQIRIRQTLLWRVAAYRRQIPT